MKIEFGLYNFMMNKWLHAHCVGNARSAKAGHGADWQRHRLIAA
jgi:hypothetical protein